ncbi:hypothetical protein DLAC_08670 [Tieghemostelium lacteum]|uniref:Acyltransferase 3 domain-containing protein n=1 Tax=Tieghemostelium lacteum TaxID=361077 RepID=A0A151Z7Z0_TIELA|nr:hypothetical protein DLAC_08670 [Tieghemostelium lacteum]|eukprot:KYQ90086.1 hypothetical protein DLAC_08670 [Tieghemostelium lacteum]
MKFIIVCLLTLLVSLVASVPPLISQPCQEAMGEILQFTYPNATEMVLYCGLKMNDLGNIDGCLSLPSNVSQFCIYQNELPYSGVGGNYYVGVCYPTVCTEDDIRYLVPSYSLSPPGVNSTTALVHCYNSQDEENRVYPIGAKIMLVFSGVIGLFLFIGTLIDWIYYQRLCNQKKHDTNNTHSEHLSLLLNHDNDLSLSDTPSSTSGPAFLERECLLFFEPDNPPLLIKLLLCFSLIKNYKSFITVYPSPPVTSTTGLLKTNPTSSDRPYFDSLDGIRTLSMIWVVLGHSLLFNTLVGYDNYQVIFEVFQRFSFQIIPAGVFAVDIFFMLSGFLVCFTVLQQLKKIRPDGGNGGIKFWIMYLIHRFIRLSPLYYYLLFAFMYIGPLLSYGPLAYIYQTTELDPTCPGAWYTNLLYYNNLVNMGIECFPVSWYLANDMQFFVFSILIFCLYKKNKIAGWILMGFLLLFSFSISFGVTLKYGIEPFFDMQETPPTGSIYLTDIYQKPWFRIGPYLVGMMVGILYHDHNALLKKIYSCWMRRYTIFFIGFSLTFIFTFIPYTAWQGKGWNQAQNALWNAFSHTMFPVGVVGYMIGSFYGYGGILKWFLEQKIFKVLSKLTYATYLCHELVVYIRIVSATQMFHYSWTEYSYTFIGNLVSAMFVAFCLHLCIEKPAINIERLIFQK